MGKSNLTANDLAHEIARRGMSQEEFARIFHVRHSTVSRWLSGFSPVPGYVEAWLASEKKGDPDDD